MNRISRKSWSELLTTQQWTMDGRRLPKKISSNKGLQNLQIIAKRRHTHKAFHCWGLTKRNFLTDDIHPNLADTFRGIYSNWLSSKHFRQGKIWRVLFYDDTSHIVFLQHKEVLFWDQLSENNYLSNVKFTLAWRRRDSTKILLYAQIGNEKKSWNWAPYVCFQKFQYLSQNFRTIYLARKNKIMLANQISRWKSYWNPLSFTFIRD